MRHAATQSVQGYVLALVGAIVLLCGALISGAVWAVSMSTLLIVVGLFLLFIELLKATKIDSASMVNNGLSMLIFVVAMILFIVVESYGTSTFFIITMMTFLDAVAGYTITAVTARRDIGFG